MDCIINIYKEKGWTSFDVTKKLRSILGEKKIGHTGTLDPAAEGVLIVCTGKATKLSESLMAGRKSYKAKVLLGKKTDTGDLEGEVIEEICPDFSKDQFSIENIEKVFLSLTGKMSQLPPMYSAKKINGKKLYEYARDGISIERKAADIEIYDMNIIDISLPYIEFEVSCSKGTYIRTLCENIGEELGVPAVMASLLRTSVGDFKLKDSLKIEDVQKHVLDGTIYEYIKLPIYTSSNTVVCFGKFDGVHKGHRLIFDKVFEIAKEKNLKTALLTFDINPESFLDNVKPSLSTSEEHISRLKSIGFDYVFSFPVNKETMSMSADRFLEEVLISSMHAKDIVAGTDCSFGYMAMGNGDMLLENEEKYGYKTHMVDKILVDDGEEKREISSSYIKELIADGDVHKASKLLGRPYAISGKVIHGNNMGGPVFGFPTANIKPQNGKVVPKYGVYITGTFIDREHYYAMTNVGDKPTVSDKKECLIESFIEDYKGDLYGKKLRIDFIEKIREQKKFSSMDELKEQLSKDSELVRKYALEHEEI